MNDDPNNQQNQTPSPPPEISPTPTVTSPTPPVSAGSSGSSSLSSESFPPSEPASPPMTIGSETPKKKKKWVTWLIIILAVLLVGGGAVWAWMWYQNPEKVVTDSVVNALNAKSVVYTGSLNYSSEDMKVKVELNGGATISAYNLNAQVTITSKEGKSYSVGGNAVFDKAGDLYIKIKDVDKLVQAFQESIPPESMDMTNKLVAKVNDKWIKISADDLSQFSAEASDVQKCTTDAIKKFQNDKEAINEVANVYKNNKFIKIDQELGLKDSSYGYVLQLDESTVKSFLKGMKDTKLYKSLHECDKTIEINEEQDAEQVAKQDDKTENRVELWVHMWSHQMTKVQASSKDKETGNQIDLLWQPTFNKDVQVQTPTDAISLQQLQADIEQLMMESLMASGELTPEEAALIQEVPTEAATQL